jgi:hypothetical protein
MAAFWQMDWDESEIEEEDHAPLLRVQLARHGNSAPNLRHSSRHRKIIPMTQEGSSTPPTGSSTGVPSSLSTPAPTHATAPAPIIKSITEGTEHGFWSTHPPQTPTTATSLEQNRLPPSDPVATPSPSGLDPTPGPESNSDIYSKFISRYSKAAAPQVRLPNRTHALGLPKRTHALRLPKRVVTTAIGVAIQAALTRQIGTQRETDEPPLEVLAGKKEGGEFEALAGKKEGGDFEALAGKKEGGEWVLVFRQTAGTYKLPGEWMSVSATSVSPRSNGRVSLEIETDNYSVLDRMEGLRRASDGSFLFLLAWPLMERCKAKGVRVGRSRSRGASLGRNQSRDEGRGGGEHRSGDEGGGVRSRGGGGIAKSTAGGAGEGTPGGSDFDCYNMWSQSSNPVASGAGDKAGGKSKTGGTTGGTTDGQTLGYKAVDVHLTANYWGGLHANGQNCVMDGSHTPKGKRCVLYQCSTITARHGRACVVCSVGTMYCTSVVLARGGV